MANDQKEKVTLHSVLLVIPDHMNDKYIYECVNCGRKFSPSGVIYLCPECLHNQLPGQPPLGALKVLYDYETLKRFSFNELQENGFLGLLPLDSLESLPNLHVGNTPLYKTNALDGKPLGFELLLKDDSQNPTFSFKDRASAVVSAYAKENGIQTIVAASTGNAGSSLAGICASQGQQAVIFAPAAAPKAKLTQILMYGATLVPVDGNYDQAFELSIEATRQFGWYNRNTAYNPLTIEGKKTVAFELFGQLGCQLPDRIFVPVGDGVIISGVYKGFEDLLLLGIIEKMPVIVAVQASGSSNIVSNIGKKIFSASPSKTIADSISVDVPRNFYMTADYLLKYSGMTVTVSDSDILNASSLLARCNGIFAEPAAAAAFAGFLNQKDRNLIPEGSSNVVLLTGSGLKDLNAVQSICRMPPAVEPVMKSVTEFLQGKVF